MEVDDLLDKSCVAWSLFSPKEQIQLSNGCYMLPISFNITGALKECGCVVDTDRGVATIYSPISNDLLLLFDRMDALRQQKEEFVAKQDFKAAKLEQDEEHGVLDAIDAHLFRMIGKPSG